MDDYTGNRQWTGKYIKKSIESFSWILSSPYAQADVELEYTLIGTKLIRKTSSRVYDDASAVIGDNNSVVDRLIDSRDPHVSPGDSQTTPSDSPASQVKEHLSPNNASAKEISLPFDIADLEQKVHKIVYDYVWSKIEKEYMLC